MARKKNHVEHTTFRNGNLFCSNCGGEKKLLLPMVVEKMTDEIDAFNKLHGKCKPTWKQPEVEQSLPSMQKQQFWLDHGERGVSSKTIFSVLSGNEILPRPQWCHPCDPDDFRRCHRLLETVPEWRNKLHLMKDVSTPWSNLVDNWGKLTDMLKDLMSGKKSPDMYNLMQSLIEKK